MHHLGYCLQSLSHKVPETHNVNCQMPNRKFIYFTWHLSCLVGIAWHVYSLLSTVVTTICWPCFPATVSPFFFLILSDIFALQCPGLM